MSKKSPQLRFEGFTDDWEERKLKDIAQFNPKTVLPDEFEYVDLESVVGTEMISHRTESKDQAPSRAQRLAQKGDVFYQTVRPYQMNNYLYDLPYDNYVFSTGYAQMRPNIDSYFLLNSVQNKQFVQHVLDRSTGTSYPAINSSDLSNIEIHVPSKLSEQQKIGSFFKQLDNTITLHQRKLDLLKEQKKGYLQKMFPKNGAKVPELRFAGFADDWEESKLGDVLSERNDQMPETNEYPLMSFVQGKGVTPKGERYNRSFLVKDSEKKYKKTELGDFIYSSNNLETGSIGFNRTGKAVISPVYSIFKSKKSRESQFIGIMSARKDFISKMVRFRQGVVYGQWRIHESDFLNIDMKMPNDKEQQLIISFFENIDKTIALQQRKLDLLKEQKKGYLQKMFV
ncbi:restriction endonuclease subunit S [Lactococcus petauri]|uniref:restriction endonuclease subunit S n=1 Tax=Lactococcus petauri TaxID=1940789 RepID=UPI0022DFDEF2|nr:restriction endonuclease subunit S [Lactococcus petauri]